MALFTSLYNAVYILTHFYGERMEKVIEEEGVRFSHESQ